MKKMILFLLTLLIIALFLIFANAYFLQPISPKRKIVFKILDKLAEKYNSTYGLQFSGFGEAAPRGTYNEIGVSFRCDKIISKDQGRVMLIECANDFLEAINAEPELQQYLSTRPFTNKNIRVSIIIHPPEVSEVLHPDYVIFSFYDNTFHYHTKNRKNELKLYTEEKETYEESLKIIETNLDNEGGQA